MSLTSDNDSDHGSIQNLPRHVAVVMDGNRRWAAARGLSTNEGYRAGFDALKRVVEKTGELRIPFLTAYAFSTENWSRPKHEVYGLMELMREVFTRHIEAISREGVKIVIAGDIDGLPLVQREAVKAAQALTAGNTGMTLCLCLNYGGRSELVRAARLLAERAARGEIAPCDIDQDAFQSVLYTSDMPDVDLLIRTSGERRLSGFLPWQASYAELLVLPCMWPDFTPEDYLSSLREYSSRSRRFGGT